MEGFLQKLRIVFRDRLGFEKGPMVVAVSGGLDSMALLHALATLRRKFSWELSVAHANHGLRGEESDRDAAFVEATAKELQLPFILSSLDVRSAAASTGESLEMAARRLRHAFLAQAAETAGARHIALAHHSDDQAELLLLRLLRGTGTEGLAGMMPRSPSPAMNGMTLLRPFLDFTRADLAEFAARHRIRFREDRTNADQTIPRNRVRHHLIPFLSSHYNPSLTHALRRLAEIAGTESDFLRAEADQWRRAGQPEEFASLHVALQRAIIRMEFWEHGLDADFETVERRRRSRISGKQAKVPKSGAAAGVAPAPSPPPPEPLPIRLAGRAGKATFDGVVIRWKIRSRPVPFDAGIEQFDADSVGPEILVRHRKSGDRFQPLGMPRPGRLQNIFINRRVPPADRGLRLVFQRVSGGLVWVEGLPPAEDAKVTAKSRRILILELARSIGV